MSETLIENPPENAIERLKKTMDEFIAIAATFGEGIETTARTIESLRRRLDEERFHLAVLGQFKRGKSTFLNALAGSNILPVSVVPLTAIPTFLRHSHELEVQVRFLDGNTETSRFNAPEEIVSYLEDYVTEEKNPKNEKSVSHVEVGVPAPILSKGVVLIDTPGIGSTLKHNTEVTLNFLAECDAALFVISADPPITETEIEFLKEVKKKVSRLFFVINKADYLDEEEKRKVMTFISEVLTNQAEVERARIFMTSAKEGLRARRGGDESLWKKSGMAAVEKFLLDFLAREKERVLTEAISKKVLDAAYDIQMRLHLSLKSYLLPLEELEEKVKIFDGKMEEIEKQRTFFQDLIEGERKRTVEFLEEQAEKLRIEAKRRLHRVSEEAIAKWGNEKNLEKRVREAIAESIPGYFERLLGEMSSRMEDRVEAALAPFEKKADELINSIRKTAAELFDIPYKSLEGASRYIAEKEPYWVTHKWNAGLSFVPEGAADALLPQAMRKARTKKRIARHIEELVLHNVENLRWVTLQNLDNTFRSFTSTLSKRMDEALESTRGAMKAAVMKRLEHAEVTRSEKQKLMRALEQIERLLEKLNAREETKKA